MPAGHPESVADKVRGIVSRTCGRKAIVDSVSLERDLGLDRADRAELLMAVELAFRIDFTESEAAAISSVRDLIATVARKCRVVAPSRDSDAALLETIEDLVVGAANTGDAIDAAAAASALLRDHPRTELSVEAICDAIERAAHLAGAALRPGSGRRGAGKMRKVE